MIISLGTLLVIDNVAAREKEEDVVTEAIHAVVAHFQDLDPGMFTFVFINNLSSITIIIEYQIWRYVCHSIIFF